MAAWSQLRRDPPAAVVIDLSRLPSHGRDVGVAIRGHEATRYVPLVFVEGDAEKVERVRQLLPDAAYTAWSRIQSDLKDAIAQPPDDPVVPRLSMEAYAGTPLPKELGIKAGSVVVLVAAPVNFMETLGTLPGGVTLRKYNRGRRDLTILFTRSQEDLRRRIEHMKNAAERGGLWIVWPKKSSAKATDLTQAVVRKIGLDAGLVDYKICAVDETWSGLKFTLRHPS